MTRKILRPCPPPKGYSLFELTVVLCVVAVLGAVFLDRVRFYQEQAEQASVEQVVAALQTALTLQFASLMARGREAEAAALAAENPMNWLASRPVSYAGEVYDPKPGTLATGSWVFDRKSRDLIYVVDGSRFFTPEKGGVKWIRFHVNLMHEAAPADGGSGNRKLTGAVIQPAESYRWFDRRL